MEIQKTPVTDSPNNDAFEAVVEAYYQTQGYITSAGKWFWVWDREGGKKQSGYQDIDVLAINGNKTIIVSVASNLDDKVNAPRGVTNEAKLKKLIEHFHRVRNYLVNVEQYRWMVSGQREIQYVVAFATAPKKKLLMISKSLESAGISLVSAESIFETLNVHACQNKIKIQHQILRAIQLLNDTSGRVRERKPHPTHRGNV